MSLIINICRFDPLSKWHTHNPKGRMTIDVLYNIICHVFLHLKIFTNTTDYITFEYIMLILYTPNAYVTLCMTNMNNVYFVYWYPPLIGNLIN